MNDESIYIVTDQGPATGIGTYAGALQSLLRGTFPNLKLLSLCYLPGPEQPRWERLPGLRVARHSYEIPAVLQHNYHQFREVVAPDSPIHFCGVSYRLVTSYPRSVVTVHDHYPRTPALVNLTNPLVLLRDMSALMQFIELPRRVRSARARVVPTQYVRDCLHRGCSLSSIAIHHWIDSSRFQVRDKYRAREALGLPADEKLVLNVSTGSSNKNYALLGRLSSRLPQGYRLVLGGGREAPRVLEGIRLPRLSDDLYPLVFNACDVYIHTSTQEGFGLPLIEAIASGLPIVSLRTQVAMEVLGDAAQFVEPTDSTHRWIDCIEGVADGTMRSEIMARAESRVSHFGLERARSAYVALYREAFGL